ncbi:MAG: SGNH/GDSL hydrolase family protein [Reichenbachiella sp.]
MKLKNLFIYIILFSFISVSCDEEDKLVDERINDPDNQLPVIIGDPGDLDLSVYVALGASITSGATDNALYTKSQYYSFPNILAQQFAMEGVEGGVFNQPDINSENGYSGMAEDGSLLGKLILNLTHLSLGNAVGELPTAYAGDKTMLNNFGVPGIQTGQMLTPFTGGPNDAANPAYNGLYARFASEPGVSTILGDAMARNPTFFTLWPGGNDVLGYAVSGGTREEILTDPVEVAAYIDAIVAQLNTANGGDVHGVIINVPYVVALPFFQAVPYNAIPMADQETADAANTGFAGYNGGVQAALGAGIITAEEAAARTIHFAIGANAILIEDPELTDVATNSGGQIPIPKYRQLVSGELVTLPASTILGTLADPTNPASVIGVGVPLGDEYSLRVDELSKLQVNWAAINAKIASVATTNSNIAHFDANAVLVGIAQNLGYSSAETGGYHLTPDFTPNGLYSNDGIHPNPRGHAIIANEIIHVLNEEFGSDISTTYVLGYDPSPNEF